MIKLLFFVSLAVSAVLAKKVCEPGTRFNNFCNTCFCSIDGTSYGCTRMQCDEDIWNQDGTFKNYLKTSADGRSLDEVTAVKKVCEPESHFNEYCNQCTCSTDGLSYGCTRMRCDKKIWNHDGTLKTQMKNKEGRKSDSKQICKPGSQFMKFCNTCICDDDGMSIACTRMFCDDELWNQDGTFKNFHKIYRQKRAVRKNVCQPGNKFNRYCNTCTCAADGSSFACTRMHCDKEMWNKDGSLKLFAKSEEVVESEKVCEAGKAYSPDGCNTCICDEYGNHFACTLKRCLPTLHQAYYKAEETEKWGSLYKQGDICTPGKAFYSECNQCVCTANGNNAFCTLMSCPSRV